MKQFFIFALCMVMSYIGRAQALNLDLHNNRPCDAYMILYGDNGCGTTFSTAVTMVPAFAHWNMLTTSSFSWVGGSTPKYFTGARIYQYDPATCPGASSITIGESCVPLAGSASLLFLDNTCSPCIGAGPSLSHWNTNTPTSSVLIIDP